MQGHRSAAALCPYALTWPAASHGCLTLLHTLYLHPAIGHATCATILLEDSQNVSKMFQLAENIPPAPIKEPGRSAATDE